MIHWRTVKIPHEKLLLDIGIYTVHDVLFRSRLCSFRRCLQQRRHLILSTPSGFKHRSGQIWKWCYRFSHNAGMCNHTPTLWQHRILFLPRSNLTKRENRSRLIDRWRKSLVKWKSMTNICNEIPCSDSSGTLISRRKFALPWTDFKQLPTHWRSRQIPLQSLESAKIHPKSSRSFSWGV